MKIIFHSYDFPSLEKKFTSVKGVKEILANHNIDADAAYSYDPASMEFKANGWVIDSEDFEKFLSLYAQ